MSIAVNAKPVVPEAPRFRDVRVGALFFGAFGHTLYLKVDEDHAFYLDAECPHLYEYSRDSPVLPATGSVTITAEPL